MPIAGTLASTSCCAFAGWSTIDWATYEAMPDIVMVSLPPVYVCLPWSSFIRKLRADAIFAVGLGGALDGTHTIESTTRR